MEIDTTAILQEIETKQQGVYTRLQGIMNLSSFKDFSPADRESIAMLAAEYNQEYEGLQLGHAVFDKLPLVTHIDNWKAMRDRSIEFLDKLESASTYEEWKIVFALAGEWFQLMRSIVKEDPWTELLDQGVKFFLVMTALGYPAVRMLAVPPSMIATMNREVEETRAAQSLFVAELIAVKMIFNVSEEEPI